MKNGLISIGRSCPDRGPTAWSAAGRCHFFPAVSTAHGRVDGYESWLGNCAGLFSQFSFTSDRAQEKVIDLCRVLARYSGMIKLICNTVYQDPNGTARRWPRRITDYFYPAHDDASGRWCGRKERAEALITGESLGQVASQTVSGPAATEAVVDLPVLRPLIGLDKQEIIKRAKELERTIFLFVHMTIVALYLCTSS